MTRISSLVWLIGLAVGATGSTFTSAGDWPQILGPNRNGIAGNERIAATWPNAGPPTLWQRKVGSGFAGIAVADGTAVLFHRQRDREIVEAMTAATGKVLWTVSYPTTYSGTIIADDGPRCVPLIHHGRVVVFGAGGGLRCIELKTGQKLWSRETFHDYGAKRPFHGEPPEGYFGFGSTPIIEGDKVLVNVGGRTAGAGLVAFSLKSGKTIWKATDEMATYSAPIAFTFGGVRHVVFLTRLHVVSINPADGQVRFRLPFGALGPKITGACPVLHGEGDRLFLTASYGIGAMDVRVEKSGARVLWRADDLLSSQYTTPICDRNILYGIDGRQDIGVASLRCLDLKTRTIRWEKKQFGYATLIAADKKLLILKTNGELILAAMNPDRYQELARSRVFRTTARALPALAAGRLYLRDTGTLKCLDLRNKEK